MKINIYIHIAIICSTLLLGAEQRNGNNELGKLGDFASPTAPANDRAMGFLIQGKVRSSILNFGSFIDIDYNRSGGWDSYPVGLWGEYAYLPTVAFMVGVPGVCYSFKFTTDLSNPSWLEVEKFSYSGDEAVIFANSVAYSYWFTEKEEGSVGKCTSDFKKISPFSKIPIIIDHAKNQTIFESGAILIYLAEQSGKFYDVKDRNVINQWLMAQMGTIGPMLGQHHQFHHYNPGKSEFGEERFFKIAKRLYSELDERLSSSEFLAGTNYTIADIATWPWIARHEWHDIGLKNYKNLSRWYVDISKREAVLKGYQFMNKDEFPPQPLS